MKNYVNRAVKNRWTDNQLSLVLWLECTLISQGWEIRPIKLHSAALAHKDGVCVLAERNRPGEAAVNATVTVGAPERVAKAFRTGNLTGRLMANPDVGTIDRYIATI